MRGRNEKPDGEGKNNGGMLCSINQRGGDGCGFDGDCSIRAMLKIGGKRAPRAGFEAMPLVLRSVVVLDKYTSDVLYSKQLAFPPCYSCPRVHG